MIDFLRSSRFGPWLVWGLGALFGLYTFLLQGSPSVMIHQLMKTYHIDVVKIGVLTSSFFYTYILMQIPAGMVIDLWGPRRVLKFAFIICPLSVGWYAFSYHFWEGQMSRMIMGLTCSPAIIAAFCLGSRWFKPALFTLIVALTEFLALAGGVIGEGGLARSVFVFGWRETMMGVAVIGLLMVFLLLFIIQDYPDHDQPLHNNGMTFKETFKQTRKSLIKILKINPLWINGIYGGCVFAIFPAFAALWGIPYFQNRYGISVDQSALVASTYFLGGCIGTLTLGWMSVYITKRKPVMLWGALIAFFLSLTIIYIPHVPLWVMFILMLFFGFFCSTYPLSFALADHYVSHQSKGVAMGFTNMLCIAIGAPILQPLIGFLLKWSSECEPINRLKIYTHHDYTVALTVIPLSLLLAFVLSFFVTEDPRSKPLPHGGHQGFL